MSLSSLQVTGIPARRCGRVLLEDVAWAHDLLARRFPRHFTCLMLAISARAMLRRRKAPRLLVLGAKRNRGVPSAPLAAHAWVISEGIEVVGGDTREGHVPVAAYRDRGRESAA